MMNTSVPKLVLLELCFGVLLPVRNLPHYHGAQWSALFRTLLKRYFPQEALAPPPSPPSAGRCSGENAMSVANIWIHPIETGVLAYEKDEPIRLGLTFPIEYA
ncbi:MAG: hypothetical protein WCQ90_15990, partial [Deltaproteobacteria bacterium]